MCDDEKFAKMICDEKFVKKFGDDEKYVKMICEEVW